MLGKLFGKEESLVAVDIGASSLKLVELNLGPEVPELKSLGSIPTQENIFSANSLTRLESVGERITALFEANGVSAKKVITAVPGPAVFTKKIRMPIADMDELRSNIQFEAGNFIPHSIDAVHLDFHVSPAVNGTHYDVLVVAIKNEIVDGFVESFRIANLEPVILDVDYFALQNLFEFSYPESVDQTVALLNVGARYTALNICRGGDSIFTGDIPVGGRMFTEAIQQGLGVNAEEAEKLKRSFGKAKNRAEELREVVDSQVEQVAVELNRQLTFFWNASGAEDNIERIYLAGGAAAIPGLVDELSEKTGLHCTLIDPFKGVAWNDKIDRSLAEQLGPSMAVCVGLGLRQLGDKIVPDMD